MTYEAGLQRAWDSLCVLKLGNILSVRFLADEYTIDVGRRSVISSSCNIPPKEYTAILIVHYAARKLQGMPPLAGEWATFREFSGIEGYYQAFKERVISPLIRKYGDNPAGLWAVSSRFPIQKAPGADAGIVVYAFEEVPVLIKVWRADEDFGPDANVYFDRNITGIFCVEDIVVLAGIVAGSV